MSVGGIVRGPLRCAVVSRQPRGARWRPRGRKPGRERAAARSAGRPAPARPRGLPRSQELRSRTPLQEWSGPRPPPRDPRALPQSSSLGRSLPFPFALGALPGACGIPACGPSEAAGPIRGRSARRPLRLPNPPPSGGGPAAVCAPAAFACARGGLSGSILAVRPTRPVKLRRRAATSARSAT